MLTTGKSLLEAAVALKTSGGMAGQQPVWTPNLISPARDRPARGDCYMSKAVKYAERTLTAAAQGAWTVFEKLNSIRPNASFTPKWSDKPLLKSYQKEKPPLGWPRTTDSLCPKCVPEIRQQIIDGKLPHEILLNEKVGEIKAQIIERDGKILMVKDCPKHGHFEDVMSIDTAFFKHLEEVFPGRDIRAHNDEKLHNHGTSTVTHGRGSVLTIDLTNRS